MVLIPREFQDSFLSGFPHLRRVDVLAWYRTGAASRPNRAGPTADLAVSPAGAEGGRRRGDSNSRGVLSPTFLAGRRTRPLCDVSIPGSTGGGGSLPGAGPGGQTARGAPRAERGPGRRPSTRAGRGRAAGGSRWVPRDRRAGAPAERGPAGGARRGRDSNPRCARRTAVFKTATLGRSVTSPVPRGAGPTLSSPARRGARPRLQPREKAPLRFRRGLQPREKKPRRRDGWAVTGMREAGWSRRPSASAGPMAGQTGRREARVACRAW